MKGYYIIIFWLIIICIGSLIMLIKMYLNKDITDKQEANRKESLIKVFQEIAYDYHIRIIKAGRGSFIYEEDLIPIATLPYKDEPYLDMGVDNILQGAAKDIQYEYFDSGDTYFINFRILGRCYLAYSNDEVSAWITTIRKGRAENKKLFRKI